MRTYFFSPESASSDEQEVQFETGDLNVSASWNAYLVFHWRDYNVTAS